MNIVMNEAVLFFRALADETRWRIVRLVSERALCVCELSDILEMPQSSVSSHVQIIRKSGMLESEKCGKWTYFRVAKSHLAVVRAMTRRFPNDGNLTHDAERAEKRMEERADSCCPGPMRLNRGRKISQLKCKS